MLKFLFAIASFVLAATSNTQLAAESWHDVKNILALEGDQNNCISFTVGQGTGCAWMCNYCATELGTNNYQFVDGVCTYQPGGCVGNPQAGHQYTCCSL